MFDKVPESAWSVLACCQCGARLSRICNGAKCNFCDTQFAAGENGALDLRLKRPKQVVVEFELGKVLISPGFEFKSIQVNHHAEVDFSGASAPWHITPELLSYFPKAPSKEGLALDLGCGSGLHRTVCERAGYQWVGLDYNNPQAPILGDGHALPFLDESIDFVFSMAVLEHIQYPFVFVREVARVLKPNGLYIGTVAFLEPFHGNSFYHHTHLGTFNTLSSGGLTVVHVGPNRRWSGLRAQATMGGLFPRVPEILGRGLVWPIELIHRFWWRAGALATSKATEASRLLTNTGAFEFVARKASR